MIEIMIEKLKKKIEEEFKYFLNNPKKVDAENINGAITRCFGALTLTTDVLYELDQKDLANLLDEHWEYIYQPAFYEILHKSWGC